MAALENNATFSASFITGGQKNREEIPPAG